MSVVFEGHGTTFTFANVTVLPIKITVPGWAREMIDKTTLSNSAWKTKKPATLRELNDMTLTVEFDPGAVQLYPTVNQQMTLTFPSGAGSLVFWGAIKSVSDPDVETDGRMTQDIVITPTNLNASDVETAPVFAGS